MKIKKINFIPSENLYNKYVKLMQECFSRAGFSKSDLKESRYVWLSWYESVNSVSLFRAWLSFFKKFLFILFLKLSGKKMVWTFHNKFPHDNKFSRLNLALEREIVFCSSYIIIHSKISREVLTQKHPGVDDRKIIYLPHPNYLKAGPTDNEDRKNENTTAEVRFLFLGMILPYKNLESLIETFNKLDGKHSSLSIYGKAPDADYGRKIEELCKTSSNIEIHLGYVDDDQLPDIFSSNDILITPYVSESMLNSGTHILAFSYGMPVLTTPVGTDFDIPKELWFPIEDQGNIEEAISAGIEKIVDNYSRQELKSIGRKLSAFMKDNNSIDLISSIIKAEIL